MALTLERRTDARVLRMSGEITVSCAAELQRVLVDALRSDEPLAVHLGEVSALDISAIQLLVAARRAGRALALAAPLPAEVADWFRLAGLDPFTTAASPDASPDASGARTGGLA